MKRIALPREEMMVGFLSLDQPDQLLITADSPTIFPGFYHFMALVCLAILVPRTEHNALFTLPFVLISAEFRMCVNWQTSNVCCNAK